MGGGEVQTTTVVGPVARPMKHIFAIACNLRRKETWRTPAPLMRNAPRGHPGCDTTTTNGTSTYEVFQPMPSAMRTKERTPRISYGDLGVPALREHVGDRSVEVATELAQQPGRRTASRA